MRRKAFILLAAAVAGVLLLTACTSSENEDMQAAGAGTSSGTASQTISGQSVDGQSSGTGDSTLVGGTGSTASEASAATDGTGQAEAGESSTAASDGTAGTTSAGNLTDSSDASAGVITGEFDGVAVEDSDESEIVTGDIWSGVYSDEEETITVTYLDAETIAFAFAQAGISGKADVKGTQAVYKGDDYHVVVFNIQDDILTVDVASEEDYDVSGSPLIGTYTRDQEEPTT